MSFDINICLRRAGRHYRLKLEEKSRVIGLVGESGSGKTTSLHMIAGLIRPDSGHICIADQTYFDHTNRKDMPTRDRKCGYVFQDRRLFPHLNVNANLRYGMRKFDAERFEFYVDLLALKDLLHRQIHGLSGGEAQRVAIARALLYDPAF
ncbi:MAG: ATP-binding cassette domain-containing protein, partial [Alphaproteobacteria bacterium]|nr:ATP-binding cassette domain-containing protein [Alphaproteobacteria bacterium]